MRVVIAGGHGKIALLLERVLAERGDQAVGLIRNPAHAADVRQALLSGRDQLSARRYRSSSP
jgi:NAD(P)-dependent dehydrogenase (short-subunit alcohol dehydrogenase family)